jgi:hypothetical protein
MMLPIPQAGLEETLRAWSGRGELWEALASIQETSVSERQWTWRDIERRAHRVLFAEIVPLLRGWPMSVREWLDALPAESHRSHVLSATPVSGVSWTDTRRLGWPPREFLARPRQRTDRTALVTTLSWALEELERVASDALAIEPGLADPVGRQFDAARQLRSMSPVVAAASVAPDRAEVVAMASEGRPWIAVARVVEVLRSVWAANLTDLALRLVMPSEDLRWRLFHLAVLGTLLIALHDQGCTIISRRPLSGAAPGPAYVVTDGHGRDWDLWFEAGGAWGYYNNRAPYLDATRGLGKTGRPLGADLLLIRSNESALILECKYSSSGETVGRVGYEQTVTYAAETRSRLAPKVMAAVIAPAGVSRWSETELISGYVGIGSPEDVPALVGRTLSSIVEQTNGEA